MISRNQLFKRVHGDFRPGELSMDAPQSCGRDTEDIIIRVKCPHLIVTKVLVKRSVFTDMSFRSLTH